jgi:hypothetical protein
LRRYNDFEEDFGPQKKLVGPEQTQVRKVTVTKPLKYLGTSSDAENNL